LISFITCSCWWCGFDFCGVEKEEEEEACKC
jgi:hypothetical protein